MNIIIELDHKVEIKFDFLFRSVDDGKKRHASTGESHKHRGTQLLHMSMIPVEYKKNVHGNREFNQPQLIG